jgi:integrase
MILLAYRHGLRAAELIDLRWDQVDFDQAVLHVRRVKNGIPSTHPLTGSEMRSLRRLRRDGPDGPFVFVSERGAPFSTAGFARMLERAADVAGLEIKVHPHMLRHACGYKLANDGHDNPLAAGLPRTQEHPAHGALHRAGANQVQELLEGLRKK